MLDFDDCRGIAPDGTVYIIHLGLISCIHPEDPIHHYSNAIRGMQHTRPLSTVLSANITQLLEFYSVLSNRWF